MTIDQIYSQYFPSGFVYVTLFFYLHRMKQTTLSFAGLSLVIFLVSCAENNQDQAGTTSTPQEPYVFPSSLNQQQQTATSPSNTNETTINMQPVAAAENNNTSTGSSTLKYNPAHGQPGHRCDLPDGAPLDGSVQPTTASNTNTQPVTINTTQNNSAASSNVKINPAHGQPGHRCDIAVGAPLDGSAKPNANVQANTQPVTINATQNTTTTSNSDLKINPAHGQPGHRCDIAVGAPLDGSTATKTAVQATDPKNPLQYYQPVQKVEPAKSKTADTTKN